MAAGTPESAARLASLLAKVALAAAALTFVVIVASAFLRHRQAGLGCAEWPTCYARMASDGAAAPPGTGVRIARIAHRLAATGVLALVIGMLLIAWTQKPAWKRTGSLALAALGIAAALALLGIATPGARLPAITLGNLLGGFALLAVLAAAFAATISATVAPGTRTLAAITLALVVAQAALGAMIGAQYASLACPAFGDCGAWSWTDFAAGGAWDPLRAAAVSDGRATAPAGAAGLHVLHRWNGLAVAALALATARALRRGQPRVALALAGLVVTTAALGAAAVSTQSALALVVAHNAAAALTVALLAYAVSLPPAGGPSRQVHAARRN